MTTLTLSKPAINEAILAFEVSWSRESGFAVYNRKYARPVVPLPKTTDSGVTIGMGYDCGHVSAATIKKDWSSVIPMHMVNALAATAGFKKQKAVDSLSTLGGVVVRAEPALQVFYNNTIYKFGRQAFSIYPNLPNLHPVEQSVIVGLVYNRGMGLDGDRRREMRQLITDIKEDNDLAMATSIRRMSRLWPDVLGLRRRRELEASLIELPDIPLPESEKLYITF